MGRLILWILFSLGCRLEALEGLRDLYQTEIPFTFGMLLDMNCKIYALQNSNEYYRTNLYIGTSGNLQMKIVYARKHLPESKKEAEKMIEDTSLRIREDAVKLAQKLWSMYPDQIPPTSMADGKELITTLIYLDGSQIGFTEEGKFLWLTRPRDMKVIRSEGLRR